MNGLENWMGMLPNDLREVPVIHLAIPGSHDSGTCSITHSSPVSPDSSPVIKQLCKIFGSLARRFIYNWVITQHSSLTEQLRKGIRYLDLRLATKTDAKDLYFVHGLYGEKIYNILHDVRSFLDSHLKEIVILDFQHFYAFTEDDHTHLLEMIHSIFGSRLCPVFDNLYHITLNWMFANGYQVIVIYRNGAAAFMQTCWPSNAWPTPWPNTTNVNDMLRFLSRNMTLRPHNAGYVTQCVLTPDGRLIFLNPLSTLEQKCAAVCNSASVLWLKEQMPGQNGLNVVILDFIDMKNIDFCQTVVQLNNKLLRHSVHI